MISNFMSALYYPFEYHGMFSDVISDTKERRFDIVHPQCVEDKFCGSGHRPVVKGQEQLLTP